jgi:hypothetical protein
MSQMKPEARSLRLPALDPATVPAKSGSSYPEPYRAAVQARAWRPLGDALGLKNFGVGAPAAGRRLLPAPLAYP